MMSPPPSTIAVNRDTADGVQRDQPVERRAPAAADYCITAVVADERVREARALPQGGTWYEAVPFAPRAVAFGRVACELDTDAARAAGALRCAAQPPEHV